MPLPQQCGLCYCGLHSGWERLTQKSSRSLKLWPLHAEAVLHHVPHELPFLLTGEVSDLLEIELLRIALAVDRPCVHCEAELDIALDFSSVGGSVEKSELDSFAGEEAVQVDSTVTSCAVMVGGDSVSIASIH